MYIFGEKNIPTDNSSSVVWLPHETNIDPSYIFDVSENTSGILHFKHSCLYFIVKF